jgi:hypothetical protein
MRAKPNDSEESYRGLGRLPGRAAIITGGDSGIGRAVFCTPCQLVSQALLSRASEGDRAPE